MVVIDVITVVFVKLIVFVRFPSLFKRGRLQSIWFRETEPILDLLKDFVSPDFDNCYYIRKVLPLLYLLPLVF